MASVSLHKRTSRGEQMNVLACEPTLKVHLTASSAALHAPSHFLTSSHAPIFDPTTLCFLPLHISSHRHLLNLLHLLPPLHSYEKRSCCWGGIVCVTLGLACRLCSAFIACANHVWSTTNLLISCGCQRASQSALVMHVLEEFEQLVQQCANVATVVYIG